MLWSTRQNPQCVLKVYVLNRDLENARPAFLNPRRLIRKEAWPFYRTILGVRLRWELEEPKGPKGLSGDTTPCRMAGVTLQGRTGVRSTCGATSPGSGCDCIKSLRSSYTGLCLQTLPPPPLIIAMLPLLTALRFKFGAHEHCQQGSRTCPKQQGYLNHRKTPTRPGPPKDPRPWPTVGSWGGAFSCKRGTPVSRKWPVGSYALP